MREVILTSGEISLVDDSDFNFVNQFRWRALRTPRTTYARATINGKVVLMHRILMQTPVGMHTDHLNSNGLDNRRENLRVCTQTENKRNARPAQGKSSPYKGVSLIKGTKTPKYSCKIYVDGKLRHLGTYSSPVHAALRYDHEARENYGEFAYLNFPNLRLIDGEVYSRLPSIEAAVSYDLLAA